jgi:hypothetical protein
MSYPHPRGEKNKKLVLDAMDSLQRKDIGRNVSPKEIMNQLKGKLHYRTIMRQLNKLKDERCVVRIGRGEYCTRATIEKRSEREQAFRSILSIARQNLRGVFKATEWGRLVSEAPANPLTYSDVILNMAREIVEKRKKTHGDEELAEKEANIWVTCLLNNICVELGSTGPPFEVVPGRFATSIRQELPIRLLGSLMSKQFVERKIGHDALIFQEAAQIVKLLIDLVDWYNWEVLDNTTELVVKIIYNPVNFQIDFEKTKHRVRRNQGLYVFPESHNFENVIKEIEAEEQDEAKQRYETIMNFLEKWSR